MTYHISIFSKTKCKYTFISLGYQFLFHLGRVANLEHTRFRVSVLQVKSYLNPPMHFHQLPSWQSTTQLGLSVQTPKSLLQFPRKILAVLHRVPSAFASLYAFTVWKFKDLTEHLLFEEIYWVPSLESLQVSRYRGQFLFFLHV